MSTIADPRDVIVAPVVSEKSYSEPNSNQYTFIVHRTRKTKQSLSADLQRPRPGSPLNREGSASRSGFGKRRTQARDGQHQW